MFRINIKSAMIWAAMRRNADMSGQWLQHNCGATATRLRFDFGASPNHEWRSHGCMEVAQLSNRRFERFPRNSANSRIRYPKPSFQTNKICAHLWEIAVFMLGYFAQRYRVQWIFELVTDHQRQSELQARFYSPMAHTGFSIAGMVRGLREFRTSRRCKINFVLVEKNKCK